MLIVEIALGVFLGGVGLWMFVSYREKKKRSTDSAERLQVLFKAADGYITQRFESLAKDYLDVFRGRLATIFDDPNCSPKVAALAEFEIFTKQTEQLKTQAATEVQVALKEKVAATDQIGEREKLNQYIDSLIGTSLRRISDESMLLLTNELLSLNDDSLPSVAQGHPRKQFNLGNAYRLGQQVEQNYREAVRLLRLSAAQGYKDAQVVLGQMYYEGEGVEQDYEEAHKLFRLAAAQGDGCGQNILGLMYANGEGVEQDYQEALKWHQTSAAQGFAAAQTNLGVMYYKGQGVAQDYVRARMWFNLAAAHGDSEAQNNLDVMNKLMTTDQITEIDKLAKDCEKINYTNCD
jgi:TPR repeat protein